MALNLSLLLGAFLLIILIVVTTIPITVESKSVDHTKPTEKSFRFLQHLEGCHKGQTVKGLHALKGYLQKFGYLKYVAAHAHGDSKRISSSNVTHANDDEFDNLLESAVKAYQSNHHLKVTGRIDSDTVQEMMLPRCGMPDVVNATNNSLLLNIVPQYTFFPGKPKWPPSKTRLTYSFKSSAQVVGMQVLRSVCSRAFKRWQDVSNFTFEEAAPQAPRGDIVIGFHRRYHGDRSPFDGLGKILAHAFAPPTGWLHYDADENWSTNPMFNQVDLESVAVHEIGHLLGLGHSSDKNAIMYPSFSFGTIKRNLNADDIQAIRVLYS